MNVWYRPKTENDVAEHILKSQPSLYLQSRTSTVLSYSGIEEYAKKQHYTLVDLSCLKPVLAWKNEDSIDIKGAATWLDLKQFALSRNRRIMTTPTESLAGVLAGLATSCTGEHSFGYGTLRDQVISCHFLNYQAEKVELSNDKKIESLGFDRDLLNAYSQSYSRYKNFKNAPFPRLETETDLMIGSEGQLGIITDAILKTVAIEASNFYFILLPRWEFDYSAHLEIYEKIQSYKGKILSCEMIDWNALSYLPKDNGWKIENHDVVFIEVLSKYAEEVFENFFKKFLSISMNDIFAIDESKFHKIRKNVPRFINEVNTTKGIVKKGTDVQGDGKSFKQILDIYKSYTTLGVSYNLFGHFGDAHLHFNFLPEKEQIDVCEKKLDELYLQLSGMNTSPFAEHGIGLIKQNYIKNFWDKNILLMFKFLKHKYDPHQIFFPSGYMGIKSLV